MTPASPIGLVHDYLLVLRGAERTFAAMTHAFRGGTIHTTLYDERGTSGAFAGRDVRTSWLQRTGVRQRGFRRLLPLMPTAIERLDVAAHDILVSSSSAFAHGVARRADAVHVCYCHTPFRYAWFERDTALSEVPGPVRPVLNRELDRIRRWDLAVSERVTKYVANSRITQERIASCWGRESPIVHPPVALERFTPGTPGDRVLIVSELVLHKRIHVALDAARRAGRGVMVVGDGPDRARLEAIFPEAEFLGRIGDPELAEVYASAAALVVPNVEEFGITAVEAQASGRPVIGRRAGGTGEIVIDGETGVLLERGDADELADALRHVDLHAFDPARIRKNAERFSVATFQEKLVAEVAAASGRPAEALTQR